MTEAHQGLNGLPEDALREPLAFRMRPRTLDEMAGQQHLIGPGRALRRLIESDQLTSLILWGPPGSGKTTLAEVIAASTKARFSPLSAVSAGVADLRAVVAAARKLREFNGQRTILFVDEIHRFNKAQQDAVLPFVEAGVVTLIGATTENPGFEVNPALRSRCRIFRLERLSDEDIVGLLRRALSDAERGLAAEKLDVSEDLLFRLARMSDGDARIALSALEMAAAATESEGRKTISAELLEDVMQSPTLLHDRAGDMHYQLISAYIKSVRGSDPDAAVYWLGRMIEAGEDPVFIARRMIILAAEDIGLADPSALSLAVACLQAVHAIGMPEGYLPLTEATLYLALTPKSNSAITTYGKVREDVLSTLTQPVPLHLRNAVTSVDRAQGYGREYRYAHDFPEHYVAQQYLPDSMVGKSYYEPSDQGQEAALSRAHRARRSSS